ncbi:MAG: thiamine phosphate synthase [Candidatus Omnitrophica bacterium]|nr:thiamine phosphate synthase [Candidatus Omnitrophota bacterium]MDD5237126.1 thiamine phosphate synthase [Candidatus Omnitrophota bacterium]MDD5610372.1 thiamine phosphate synthase [Candidatus Omnitrophota bacterium]
MNWKKSSLRESGLCIILDKDVCRDIFSVARKIKNTGLCLVQLRAKNTPKRELLATAKRLNSLFKKSRVLFIINDHADIAQLVNAHGVHLGQDDLPVKQARKFLGKDKIIGVSCHNLRQAQAAEKQGADYIGLGPIFKTPVKIEDRPIGLGVLKKVEQKIKIPVFAIGGINRNNLSKILSTGASHVALCRDVCLAKNITLSIKGLKKNLNDTD